MKVFKDLVSKDKVSGFEASARKDMENQQWMNKSFDIALLIIAKCQELGLSKADLIDKTGLHTNKVIQILSGRADLTLSEITKLEEVLNTQLIEIIKK
jgi:antitoxin component HigA of HigAB toxin-antitoxin module